MKQSNKSIQIATMVFIAMAAIFMPQQEASAVKAYPHPITVEQPDGTTVEILLRGSDQGHAAFSLDGRRVERNAEGFVVYASETADESYIQATRALGDTPRYVFPGTAFPNTGEPRALVVLVEFANKAFSMLDPQQFYYNQLNGENFTEYGAQKSARKYFIENSNGLFRPQFDVLGPVKLTKPYEYYGQNDSRGDDQNPDEMVLEACEELGKLYNMAVYDNDGDGFIDNVFVIYAGNGEADSWIADTIWPHSADLTTDFKYEIEDLPTFQGVKPNRYGCTCELVKKQNRPDGIGTFIHEFSHILGLPDLYHTTLNRDGTPGAWSVLDMGPYNNNGVTPPNYSAHERYALNWIEPEVIDKSDIYSLEAIDQSNRCLMVKTENPDEFFLFENRQPNGGDMYLPGHGMLIWHIDYNEEKWLRNIVNNTISHQCVDLVEADGIQGDKTNVADAWPGTLSATQFGFNTTPALKSWAGNNLGVELTDIAEQNGIVSFVAIVAETSVGEISAVTPIAYAVGNCIFTSSDEPCAVFDITGATRGNVTAGAPLQVSVPGLCIVSDGKTAVKVFVK